MAKTAILLKVIYTFNISPIKIPTQLFTDYERTILSFEWEKENAQSKNNLNHKRTARGLTVPNCMLYYRGISKNN